MNIRFVIALCSTLICTTFAADTKKQCELTHTGDNYQFPKDFAFGVSTSAYQIEGAWNRDGKAPSGWDTFTHKHPEAIIDRTNADDAAESYERFAQDLAALKELKVNFYRFSISWSRVLPNITTVVKNQKGIDYYNKIIDSLLANNITPMATMYHYDTPEKIDKLNGFLNDSFIDYFQEYASFLFETFGDRVKLWLTFNQPYFYCNKGYGTGEYPPLVRKPGVGDYLCMHHTLLAHAKTYRLYRQRYYNKQRGKIGLVTYSQFFYKKNENTTDVAFERGIQYELGWLNEPIYGKTGNYPTIMIEGIRNNSFKEGLTASRLPVIDNKWSKIIKGSADFLALNYYTSAIVEMGSSFECNVPSYECDQNITLSIDDKWRKSKSDWLLCVPQGLEDILKWIRDNYDNVEVMLTENGWSDDGQLDDIERIEYLQAHLQAVLNAINAGCNVTHFAFWSLLDNFEWQSGYTEKFGLYYVNFTSENKDRIRKESAKYYTKVIESRSLRTTDGAHSHTSYSITVLLSICIFVASLLLKKTS